jgi:hypothetical protein
VLPQRLKPGKLGLHGAGLVVAGAMHAQHGYPAGGRFINPVGGVLRQAQQGHPRLW